VVVQERPDASHPIADDVRANVHHPTNLLRIQGHSEKGTEGGVVEGFGFGHLTNDGAMWRKERQKPVWEPVAGVTSPQTGIVTLTGLISVRGKDGVVGGTGLEPVTSSV
jgi:hypothetical protein